MLISPQIYNLAQRFFSNFLNFLNRCSMILRLYLVQRLMISNLVRSRELDHILGRLSLLRLLSFFLHHTLYIIGKLIWDSFSIGNPPLNNNILFLVTSSIGNQPTKAKNCNPAVNKYINPGNVATVSTYIS